MKRSGWTITCVVALLGTAAIPLAAVAGSTSGSQVAELASTGVPATPELPESMTVRSDLSKKDLARVRAITALPTDFSKAEAFEAMPGGAATSTKLPNRSAFSHFSANLTFAEQRDFNLGDGLFRKLWVSSPSSTQASDGLGPLFNARSCQSCHLKDGRGHPPVAGEANTMFFRLSRPAQTDAERQALASYVALTLPDPSYGDQLQDLAVPGLAAEAQMTMTYTEEPVTLGDGSIVSLQKPTYGLENLAYGPLDAGTTLSPRVTPQMIGMGLIEAIHPADIIARADPDDANGDGISGRIALRRDAAGELELGRFGWKGQNARIREQTAGAFAGDMGISTPDAPNSHGDCTARQTACLNMPTGVQTRLGTVEAPDPVLDLVTFYAQNLAVPQRRDVDDPNVLAGKQLFQSLGCASCHTPKYVTRRDAENKAQSFQLIWPHSDFLLHDMGDGLADGQTVGAASGTEWRTPPLWGIGLTEMVSGHTNFLHDGRARNLTEAVLWHGGEAQSARDAFAGLDKPDRDALLAYLESL